MREVDIIEIDTTLTAYEIYQLFEQPNHSFLDSSMEQENRGEYSFIGLHPFLEVRQENGIVKINDQQVCGNIYEELNKVLKKYQCINNTTIPFISGGIGYFSYDLVDSMEDFTSHNSELVYIPTCCFHFYDNLIIYDHKNSRVYITALGILEDSKKSIQSIKQIIDSQNIKSYKKMKIANKDKKIDQKIRSDFSQNTYIAAVEQMKEYIKKGDIYIANMTHTFVAETRSHASVVYRVLREINQAPFSAYLPYKEFNILSSSPERFLRIQDGKVETRPIKGTRPRGKTLEEDLANKNTLVKSEKDHSELLMIVDLERNDLSKVCKPHSVKVPELFEIKSYPAVFHLEAIIIGQLEEHFTSVDCIEACFPGGSITGAPKIRAMEIIDELETKKRNIYTGCIGYLGFDGNTDLNIIIRTILMKENKAYIGVGGGITWESNSEEEYLETLIKADALFKSLQLAKELE